MFLRKKERVTPLPPAYTELAAQEISSTYGVIADELDHFTKNRIIHTLINREIELIVELAPAFPSVAPIIKIASGTSKNFLPALEAMVNAGLMEPSDGTINYAKCFYFGPEMRISNLIFLCGIILRSAQILVGNQTSRTESVESVTIPYDNRDAAEFGREVPI